VWYPCRPALGPVAVFVLDPPLDPLEGALYLYGHRSHKVERNEM
jgi:hypothetical protein